MTTGDELPLVLPSSVDPDYECVLVDPEAATAPPADPGDPDVIGTGEAPEVPLCPPGYVPRQRPNAPYDLHGKEVITTDPPRENPEPPPVP